MFGLSKKEVALQEDPNPIVLNDICENLGLPKDLEWTLSSKYSEIIGYEKTKMFIGEHPTSQSTERYLLSYNKREFIKFKPKITMPVIKENMYRNVNIIDQAAFNELYQELKYEFGIR